MKIALVCDDLTQHGGQEKVVMDICRVFPDAPLYTTMATKKWRERCKKEGIELIISKMQKLPFKKSLNRVYAPFLFYILALENFNFNEYDVVLSISSRFAHGVITQPKTFHVCYLNTVGRMFWEPEAYFSNEGFNKFKVTKKLFKVFLKLPLSYLRNWDRVASTRPDYFIVNSITTQNRVKKYYGRESQLLYPGVDSGKFKLDKDINNKKEVDKKDYFLILTRLATWKRVDLAIKVCKELGVKLKIAGDGPGKEKLKTIASGYSGVEFLGYVSDNDKVGYLTNAKALIMTQFEDFGLVPIEAMSCGTPTIAYKRGGVLETVIEGETGEFYNEQTVESLTEALRNFSYEKYDADKLKEHAKNFDISKFNQDIKSTINTEYKNYQKD